ASAAVLASIFSDTSTTTWVGKSTVLNGFVRGSVLPLAAGTLHLGFGSEDEDRRLERGMDADRSGKAAFMELRAPVVAGADRREVLTLQAAVRYDDYSDFGTEGTWMAGIAYRPSAAILLQATSGTAFKPPTLYNLGAPISSGTLPVI